MKTAYRKEWKYVISIAEYLRLKPWLEQLLQPDAHGIDGTYTVRSLYFDSLYDRDFYDNLDGVLEKRKIRLRCYPPDFGHASLEYKAKDGSDGFKRHVTLGADEIRAVQQGDYSCLAAKDDAVARGIYQRMIQGVYRPKTVIEYTRTAYLYPVSDTRITFDQKQRATGTGIGFLEKEPSFLPLMPDNMGVLEMKYNDFLPYPIMGLMQNLDRLWQANSKYTQARELI